MFTDGSRLDSSAAGCSVVWKKGQAWVGIKTHMGCNQEAYGAEKTDNAGAGHDFYGCPSSHKTNGFGGARPSQQYALRQDNTSPHCGGRGQASSSRFGGAQPTRELPAMKRPTNGPSLRQRSQTPVGQNGCAFWIGARRAQCLSQDLLHTSSGEIA